jgi:hypothetical protein
MKKIGAVEAPVYTGKPTRKYRKKYFSGSWRIYGIPELKLS